MRRFSPVRSSPIPAGSELLKRQRRHPTARRSGCACVRAQSQLPLGAAGRALCEGGRGAPVGPAPGVRAVSYGIFRARLTGLLLPRPIFRARLTGLPLLRPARLAVPLARAPLLLLLRPLKSRERRRRLQPRLEIGRGRMRCAMGAGRPRAVRRIAAPTETTAGMVVGSGLVVGSLALGSCSCGHGCGGSVLVRAPVLRLHPPAKVGRQWGQGGRDRCALPAARKGYARLCSCRGRERSSRRLAASSQRWLRWLRLRMRGREWQWRWRVAWPWHLLLPSAPL
jgi:hypothetical protein